MVGRVGKGSGGGKHGGKPSKNRGHGEFVKKLSKLKMSDEQLIEKIIRTKVK